MLHSLAHANNVAAGISTRHNGRSARRVRGLIVNKPSLESSRIGTLVQSGGDFQKVKPQQKVRNVAPAMSDWAWSGCRSAGIQRAVLAFAALDAERAARPGLQ